MTLEFNPKDPEQWQLDRMRRALRILETEFDKKLDHVTEGDEAANTDKKRKDSTWKSLADEISAFSGIDFDDGERLRKFAKGEPNENKPTGYHFPKMNPARMEALYQYFSDATVRDERGSVLPTIDLDEFEPQTQWPTAMMEFWREDWPLIPDIHYQNFGGSFVAKRQTEHILFLYHLTLEAPVMDGVLQATLFEEQSPISEGHAPSPKELAWLFDLPSVPDEVIKSKGWAFLTPDDQLILMLKRSEEDDERSKISNDFSLAVEINEGVEGRTPLINFTTLDQRKPQFIPINKDHAINPDVFDLSHNNFLYFQRVR